MPEECRHNNDVNDDDDCDVMVQGCGLDRYAAVAITNQPSASTYSKTHMNSKVVVEKEEEEASDWAVVVVTPNEALSCLRHILQPVSQPATILLLLFLPAL